MRIIQKSKTEMVSAILNIVGLAAAFAALYIILVQVHHDLTYNKALKDSDRIYCLSLFSVIYFVKKHGDGLGHSPCFFVLLNNSQKLMAKSQ